MSRYAITTDLAVYGVQAAALTGVFTTQQQQDALDSASVVADGYLASRYTLPILVYGKDLTEAVCKVAAYNLLSARGYNPEAGSDANIRQRYEDAIRWLRDVAAGTVTPQLTDSSTSVDPVTLQPIVNSDGVFTTQPPSARGW